MNKIYESVSVFKLTKLINKDCILIRNHHFHHLDSIATRLAIIISNSTCIISILTCSPAPCRHLTKVSQERM